MLNVIHFLHIPFIRNLENKSPIHLCSESQEYRYINVMLEYLVGYGIDHHSRAIVEVLPVMVDHSMPHFIDYLDSRILQTEKAKKIKKGVLKNERIENICATSLWMGQHAIDELFQRAPIEQDVRLQYIDIPDIHMMNSTVCKELIQSLADSDDMRLFNTTAVKKLIDYLWPDVLKYTIIMLFIPYLLFLGLYLCYIYIDFSSTNGMLLADYAKFPNKTATIKASIMIALACISAYLLIIEMYQLFKQKWLYLISIWNYLDLLPTLLVLVYIGLDVSGLLIKEDPTLKVCIKGTQNLLIWMKFLYFLRYFKKTGYLVRIIV